MGLLRKIELEEDSIFITLKLTKMEYEKIAQDTKDCIVLPSDKLDRILITGRLGNGNRIMVPSKFLKKHNINILKKKVKSRIIDTGERKLLLIELESKKTGIPVFDED